MAEVVVITGASSGIGRATVRRFAGPGARLALVARNRDALGAARDEEAPYCGAKHALQGVFESLRTELRARGSNVHLTTVHLPGVNTPQFERAHSRSVQLAATKHRRAVVLGAAGALVAGGVALARSL